MGILEASIASVRSWVVLITSSYADGLRLLHE